VKKTLLVTGANGMLGSAFCRFFLHKYDVISAHRDQTPLTPCSASASVDLTNYVAVAELIRTYVPDVLIHCAAVVDLEVCEDNPEYAFRHNVAGTLNVVNACKKETLIIFISSDQVYGHKEDKVEVAECLEPVNVYGASKLEAEEIVRNSHENHIIIRTNIFGWSVKSERESSAEWMVRRIRAGDPTTFFTDYFFSPIYTEDLADVINSMLNKCLTGTFNIGSSASCSKYEFAQKIQSIGGFSKNALNQGSICNSELKVPRATDLSLNVKKIKSAEIFLPCFEESIMRFLESEEKDEIRKIHSH
jgi:dTDP-4-dehydrorhamnose reductase